MENQNDVMAPAGNELVITRLVNAPRELVWEVWTDPRHIIHWFGPNGFTNTFINCDTRSGGSWKFTMHGPDGRDYKNQIKFLEVVKPERLVYKHTGEDDTEDIRFSVIVTFEPVGTKTQITMTSVFSTAEELQHVIREFGAEEGGHQTLSRLDDYVAALGKLPEGPIVIERTYHAPSEKVWSALTDKDEMRSWYFDLKEFKAELNFEFTFTGTTEDNTSYLHLCKVTDVIPGKRLEYSWKYDGYPGMSYVRFELFPEGNFTRLRLTHRGLETFPANPDFARKNFFQGWSAILGESLTTYLENKKP